MHAFDRQSDRILIARPSLHSMQHGKKTSNGPRVRRISPVGKEKVCGGNDLPESQVVVRTIYVPMRNLIRYSVVNMSYKTTGCC